jgi:DNA-binding transcriptional ArsR family regulator
VRHNRKKGMRPEGLERMARLFRILGEPSRLQLLNLLRDGEMSVSSLIQATGMNQANVSKQLKILASGKVLARSRRGRQVFYRIDDPSIHELCELMCGKLRKHFDPGGDAINE